MDKSQHKQTLTDVPQSSVEAKKHNLLIPVLSLDGGGIRGLFSLVVLHQVMIKITCTTNDDPIYPWKYFKIICGTGTGGLIALMLGRLRMSTQQAIKAYIQLGREIYMPAKWFWKEGKFNTSSLEQGIKRIVGEAQGGGEGKVKGVEKELRDKENEKKGEGVMMRDDSLNSCQTLVFSMKTGIHQVPIRTYGDEHTPAADCKIWEAACATAANSDFFEPITIKDSEGTKTTYIGSGLLNNPSSSLVREMHTLGLCACILSIGTGLSSSISIPRIGGIPKLQLFFVLLDIGVSCETIEQEIAYEMLRSEDVYVRLNVTSKMNMGMEDWKKHNKIQQKTKAYLRDPGVQEKIEVLKQHIRIRPECQ